ncbi:MAG TPA: hypothetical protein VHZ97_23350 [Pseudonocardiaceae bacterium]|nr:hypothetical protein [Pseudonocardiaceae bacterium]
MAPAGPDDPVLGRRVHRNHRAHPRPHRILVAAGVWSLRDDWDPANSATSWTLPFPPRSPIGGIFVIGVGALLVGVLLMLISSGKKQATFRARPNP